MKYVRQEAIYDLVHGRKKTGEMQKNLENTGRKPLTRVNVWDIMYNCDVRWKCLSQSPGVGILL